MLDTKGSNLLFNGHACVKSIGHRLNGHLVEQVVYLVFKKLPILALVLEIMPQALTVDMNLLGSGQRMVMGTFIGNGSFELGKYLGIMFPALVLMCPNKHEVNPRRVCAVLKGWVPFAPTMGRTKIKVVYKSLKVMLIRLGCQTVFGISGFNGGWCCSQWGVAITCNQEHMVLGNILYGILEGFPNQGSFLEEDIARFGGVPCYLINIEHVMDPSEIQSDVLEAAWKHIGKRQLIRSKERASNHAQGGGPSCRTVYHIPSRRNPASVEIPICLLDQKPTCMIGWSTKLSSRQAEGSERRSSKRSVRPQRSMVWSAHAGASHQVDVGVQS